MLAPFVSRNGDFFEQNFYDMLLSDKSSQRIGRIDGLALAACLDGLRNCGLLDGRDGLFGNFDSRREPGLLFDRRFVRRR